MMNIYKAIAKNPKHDRAKGVDLAKIDLYSNILKNEYISLKKFSVLAGVGYQSLRDWIHIKHLPNEDQVELIRLGINKLLRNNNYFLEVCQPSKIIGINKFNSIQHARGSYRKRLVEHRKSLLHKYTGL